MNERQMIERMKNNRVCWAGLTEEERDFLAAHQKDVGRYCGKNQGVVNEGTYALLVDCVADDWVFCLRPDYEPEPAKPAMDWREYAVEPELFSGDWCIIGKHSASASYTYLDHAPRMQGFGGTQYRMPGGTLTTFIGRLPLCYDEGPATPVKVRFWEVAG